MIYVIKNIYHDALYYSLGDWQRANNPSLQKT